VRAAPKLDVLDCRLASNSVRHDVMELQKALLGAAPPGAADEGAPPAVALPDHSLDLRRDVA